MTHFARSALGRVGRTLRRRPRTVLLLTVVAVLAAGAGGYYGYAVRAWRQAVTAVRDGRPAEARERLGVCLAVWPNDPAVHHLAARAARQTGDFVAAEAHLNACLRIEKGASEATQVEFLLMRAQTGEVEEVAPLLTGFVDRGNPDGPLILETIALVYMHHLRYGPAYYYLRRWIEYAPDAARAYQFRGWVLERMNQPRAAMDDYLRALELDPGLDRVRLRLAEMYLDDKQPLQAIPQLERALARNPNDPEAMARLGQCRYLQGDHGEARRLLDAAANGLPDDIPVLLYTARLDIEDGRPDKAEERLRHALAVDPSDTEVRYALVTALRSQARDQEAERRGGRVRAAQGPARAGQPSPPGGGEAVVARPGPAAEIGALLLQIHQDRQGLYWMDEALSRDPGYEPAHRTLAAYFERKGDLERAAFHRRKLPKN